MARPSKKGARAGTVPLQARIAEADRRAFHTAARDIGVSGADLLRWLARRAAQTTPAERQEIRAAIRRAEDETAELTLGLTGGEG